jgi:hypothetical protein
VLGLQGCCIDLEEPIRFSSIIVGQDPRADKADQQEALERAICGRVEQVLSCLENDASIRHEHATFVRALKEHTLQVHVVDATFESGKAWMEWRSSKSRIEAKGVRETMVDNGSSSEGKDTNSKKRKANNDDDAHPVSSRKRPRLSCTVSPCGFCINWNCRDETTEVVVGARGVCQGKKPKSLEGYRKLASRLCRQHICRIHLHKNTQPTDSRPISYREWKQMTMSPKMKQLRQAILQSHPLKGWLESNHDFLIDNTNDIR